MKLCFVMEDFNIGGVETVTYRLICEIIDKYNEIEVVIYCIDRKGALLKDYEKIADIRDVISLKSDDLSIFEHVIFTKGGLTRYFIFFPWKTNKITIQHVPIILPNTSKYKNLIRVLSSFLLYRFVNSVVSVSYGIEDELHKVLKIKNSKTIYNPVIDREKIAQKVIEYKIKEENYFICVGRIHYQKDYLYLVDIIFEVKKTIPDIKILILGSGELNDVSKLEEKIKNKNLGENIILLGSVNNPYPYIKNAKAILMTSRWEGLPTVLVESIYLGIQVISVDCKYGPKELTNNGINGYLIPSDNLDSFVKAIIDVSNGSKKEPPFVTDFYDYISAENYMRLFNGK